MMMLILELKLIEILKVHKLLMICYKFDNNLSIVSEIFGNEFLKICPSSFFIEPSRLTPPLHSCFFHSGFFHSGFFFSILC